MLKGRKRDQAAFFVAALCFSGGFALGKLVAGEWIARLQIALYAIGQSLPVYGAVRVWRLVNPPELPPAKDRPSAIKGPMEFNEADGALFRKLGRESELKKLLGLMLDDQVLMVVVRGASGVGKTSLLRAGLKHISVIAQSFITGKPCRLNRTKGCCEEKIEALAEIICRAGDEPSAALLVLMATLETLRIRKHWRIQQSTSASLATLSLTSTAWLTHRLHCLKASCLAANSLAA
jgi:hypothetical protein